MSGIRKITFPVLGLACGGGGATTIEKVLGRVPGVVAVYVNPGVQAAYVEYDPERCGPDDLRAAVEALGYDAVLPNGPAAGQRAAW